MYLVDIHKHKHKHTHHADKIVCKAAKQRKKHTRNQKTTTTTTLYGTQRNEMKWKKCDWPTYSFAIAAAVVDDDDGAPQYILEGIVPRTKKKREYNCAFVCVCVCMAFSIFHKPI